MDFMSRSCVHILELFCKKRKEKKNRMGVLELTHDRHFFLHDFGMHSVGARSLINDGHLKI